MPTDNPLRGCGLILAAPGSGSGKTLVTAGLLRLLRERGIRVAAAKAGPDYIDPTFHAAASGGVSFNLDPWAMRPGTLAGLVGLIEADADIVLCEGVMGLFDGTGPEGETGSTAALARLTGWPVVLVVDASHQGASAAALVGGFARHDPELPLKGVIFNRVAGPRHRALLEGAMTRHLPDIACLGAVTRDPDLVLPERHLGLVPAGEGATAETVIARAATAVAAGIAVDRLVGLARPASLTLPRNPRVKPGEGREGWGLEADEEVTGGRSVSSGQSPHPNPPPLAGEGTAGTLAGISPLPPLGQRIAIARDDAFLFLYPAVLEGWCRAGAELAFFSPLADEVPDPASDAVYLPGGYPELHAGRLAACAHFQAALRRGAGAGTAIYGECGGYMALGESLVDGDGHAHPMAGLLPLRTSFAKPRLHLGYRAATLCSAGPLGPAGARFRGHEFHYATTIAPEADTGAAPPLFALTDSEGRDQGASGLRQGSVMGSFIHLIDRADD